MFIASCNDMYLTLERKEGERALVCKLEKMYYFFKHIYNCMTQFVFELRTLSIPKSTRHSHCFIVKSSLLNAVL